MAGLWTPALAGRNLGWALRLHCRHYRRGRRRAATAAASGGCSYPESLATARNHRRDDDVAHPRRMCDYPRKTSQSAEDYDYPRKTPLSAEDV